MSRDLILLSEKLTDIINNGAEHADIYAQSACAHSFSYEDGKIESISSSTSDGVGVRIVLNNENYYAHCPGISIADTDRALNDVHTTAFNSTVGSIKSNSLLLHRGILTQPPTDFFHIVDDAVRKKSPYVKQVSIRLSSSTKNVIMIKPEGDIVHERRDYSFFSTNVILEKDGKTQTGYERFCFNGDFDEHWRAINPVDVAMAALERATVTLSAQSCPAGKMNVILDGSAGGTIVHEACGHGLEADIINKDYSVYRGKLGEQVAGENITMVDDATIPGLYGSYKFDDEGTPAERTVLIENGVLKTYMTDIITARKDHLHLSGNGRRQSYRHLPMPRMSNTFLLPGITEFDEMIDMASNGLLVKKMGGGEVNPTSGDFVFYVSEGYLIKNGKIATPVKGATIMGNGPEALKNIAALGHASVMDPGICGKSGQSVPVTDGQPSMFIKGLTIGGSEA